MPVNPPRPLPEGDPRHGTPNGYVNWRCRCQPCRDANTTRTAELRAKRKARAGGTFPLAHGTASTYQNWACRCRACTGANTAQRATYGRS